MKSKYLFFIVMLISNCSASSTDSTGDTKQNLKSILPFEIELGGVLREIEDVQSSVPKIRLSINQDSVIIVVGGTEKYFVPYDSNEFPKIVSHLESSDFTSNNHFYNPHLRYGGTIRLIKEVENRGYVKTITNYKRRDIEVEYHELDSISLFKSYHLSRIANEVAVPLIKDKCDRENMIIATSIAAAMQDPEKVYELKLRNKRISSLPSDIGKLKNLRILNISGSFITEIPPEIEKCENLISIIANASRLNKIPNTIGNLKKLRVINFGYCKLKTVPKELGKVTSLWSLGLGSNQLEKIPKSFSELKNLTFFSIAKNRFSEFPKPILGMGHVGNLWLHGNNIKSIPKEIKNMKGLHHFLVDASEIENIEEIKSLIPDVRIIDETNRK